MNDDNLTSENNSDNTIQPSSSDPQPIGDNSTTDMAQLLQQIAQLTEQLAATEQKLQEMTTVSQHALADLQNYKRRTEEEKSSIFSFANAQLFMDLAPVLSNIHRALLHDPKDLEWVKGTEQILRQLVQFTEKAGLTSIDAMGKPFDPRIHEALMTAPGSKDTVIEEFEKGYQLNDKVIKMAKVKVGNGEEGNQEK